MAMKHEVTLRQFRYFIAAAVSGQFSAAAQAENVSQSAISNAVQSLERQLNVALFERLPHGVELTPQGQAFFHHAHHVIDAVSDALNHADLRRQNIEGQIRVAAGYTVLGYFLPDLISRFKHSYPNIDIELVDMERPEMEAALQDERIDLGVAILSNITDLALFGHHRLSSSRRRLWVSDQHALANESSVSLEQINNYPYIFLTVDDADTAAMRHWGSPGFPERIAMRTRSLEAVRGLVAYGFGVTILSDMVYRPWSLEGKRIHAIGIHDPVESVEVGLLWPKGREPGGLVALFQRFLIQACDHDMARAGMGSRRGGGLL
ncbi:LysR family transcriptional regulator [Alcaligenes faecalis]|nr:LysR family transcriptional regulator [Alcaligenes faecalis]ATH98825.1 LysR family transcriptional regulator [Alcaligenes faecalis]AYZ91610.1 LysR family transcriptional regulator [Alcaligenes faecalis]KAA1286325.1 LysR family transcriptional regulator [Alcaligenes faecalis]MBH0310772.1 LysR family transcriptional regulator [Alcaligenes faecalis]MCX5594205.1 LysR family transcriptional regulator [Alcaligenes faecalis]